MPLARQINTAKQYEHPQTHPPHFMWCVFHHICGQYRGKLWKFGQKVGIAKDPLLPRQVIRLTQKVKSRWVGETDYYCPGENKITTFSETLW